MVYVEMVAYGFWEGIRLIEGVTMGLIMDGSVRSGVLKVLINSIRSVNSKEHNLKERGERFKMNQVEGATLYTR